MIYEFECPLENGGCGKKLTASCSVGEYESVKRVMKCCNAQMRPVITGGRCVFAREPFPKGTAITEHAMEEPVFCKDKAQLKDICEENGMVSRFVEDDM